MADIPSTPTSEKQADSSEKLSSPDVVAQLQTLAAEPEPASYCLYKWRFVGLLGLVLLNMGGGINATWFGPIAIDTADTFSISLTQVNWLGNVIQLIFLPMSIITPAVNKKFGMRNTCMLGGVLMTLGSWLRYAATPTSLPPKGTYALLVLGQLFTGAAQPIFLALGPKYSEVWFDLRGRTTATMVLSVCNPVGTAVAQIISPLVGTPRSSILILAIISTALSLPALIIKSRPPTPPTYSGSKPTLGPMVLIRALVWQERPGEKIMDFRDKFDFIIISISFGTFVGATTAFSLLSNQVLEPYGYSESTAGLMGAALILSGLLAAVLTSPIFDRVALFSHKLIWVSKSMTPILAAGWFSLIWAVRANNAGPLYAIFVIIGITSVTLLPVSLELSSEVTRNSDTASAICWCFGNLFSFIFILIENSLRDGPNANPAFNMRRALIFNGVFCIFSALTVQLMRGTQSRRKLDMEMNNRVAPNTP